MDTKRLVGIDGIIMLFWLNSILKKGFFYENEWF